MVSNSTSRHPGPHRFPRPKWLTRNVLLLGMVSLFTDIATEMVIPLLPAFLTLVLGSGALALGWIEGLADATASVLKLYSGRWSDRVHRRRPFVLAGYSISSFARPFIAAAGAVWHVLGLRVLDRVGKGIRTSARDSLIAASVDERRRGTAFGLHRAMDHAGAVIGPLLAAVYLWTWSHDLRTLFWLSAVPGLLAVAVILTGVHEKEAPSSDIPSRVSSPADEPSPFTLPRLLIPLGLFTLGNASDIFLLMKAGAERVPLVTLPLLWMGLHLVKTLSSVPGGRLADRWGQKTAIVAGWVFYALIYTGFALASSREAVWTLFVVYGLYHGLTEGAERSLVAELVPSTQWGAGFGWYHLLLGFLTLAANLLFGWLWECCGSPTAFFVSAALALAAAILLICLAPGRSRKNGGQGDALA